MSADEPGVDRPSRQSLVVPPARSNLPVAIGAMACGCAGFALVWAFGIGRPTPLPPVEPMQVVLRPASDDGAEAAAATEAGQPPVVREPRPFPVPEDAIRPVAPPERSNARHDSSADRHAVRAASLDVPAVVPTAAESRPLSKFSAPADLPPAEPAAAFEPSAPIDEPPQASAATVTEPPALVAPPGPQGVEPVAEVRNEPEELVANSDAASAPQSDAPDSEVAAPAPLAAAPPVAPPVDATPVDATPRSTAPVVNAPAPPASDSAGAISAFAAAPAFAPPIQPSAPAALPPAVAPARPLLPDGPPLTVSQPRVASAADAVPYAAAPALVPRQDVQAPAQALVPPAQGQATGPGRPGPMQLEGVQSPQLTVEKRGPREVQVGRAARYEILVRNVGSAIAQDVTLRDAIPQGTTLVATTPPASPVAVSGGGGDGELVWPLGTLPPGGQVRVVMEVMPQAEGEIGSIASVSFRADASVRSRATKPELRVEVTQPAPVLIHGDMQLALKVVNVGSGAATGIVLEGFLPDNVSHRSGRELEFDVGQLRPGESRTIDLVLGTCGPGVQAARFIVRADGGIEVSEQAKIEVTAPTLEAAIDMPLRRFLQRPATCTIAMTNAGTAPARAIELAAQLPPGLKFVRANNAGWHDERTHRVLWSLEELPAGETGSVEVVVMPVDLGPQKIMAAARSGDGLTAQAAHVCEVEGLAALVFDVADSEDPVEVNGLTEYVVRVTNQGTKPATGVRVSAGLLGDLEPVEAQGPVAHRVENLSIAFDPLAKLAPSEEAVFRIRVRGRRAGDQRVQVQLVSEDHPAPITKEEITRVYADR